MSAFSGVGGTHWNLTPSGKLSPALSSDMLIFCVYRSPFGRLFKISELHKTDTLDKL